MARKNRIPALLNQKPEFITMPPFHPHKLRNKWWELVFFPEYGCCWSTLRISLKGKWVDLLKPLSDDRPPFRYGSYLMAPWSNRIVQGTFEFEGMRFHLRKNFPDDTAIHGDVRTRPWHIDPYQRRLSSNKRETPRHKAVASTRPLIQPSSRWHQYLGEIRA